MRNNLLRQSACRDHSCLSAKLLLQTINNSIHCGSATVDQTTLHTLCSILSNHMLRCFNTDSAKLRCMSCQRIKRYSNSRINHTSDVILVLINHRNRIRRTKIKDQKRYRILCNSCHRIHHQVTSQLRRVIHPDIQSGLDSCSYNKNILLQDLLYRQLHDGCNLRHDRRNDSAFYFISMNMINIKYILNIDCIL